jgi:DAK2 domain fusion protein YloV
METNTISGANLRKMFNYSYALLDKNKAAVDALNVFPVPDGDTGINMSLTMKSVAKELDLVTSNDISNVCEAITKGALKGARGNSGVILSQILKGIMGEIVATKSPDGTITTRVFANAMTRGAETAYKAVTIPKEGTILTVIRVMAEEAKKIAKHAAGFEKFFDEVLQKGEDILAQTPEMLPVLKKAGVVDAGGRGLLVIFAAFLAVLRGTEDALEINFDRDGKNISGDGEADLGGEGLGEIEFAYCTEFMVTQMYKTTTTTSIDNLRDKLMRMGDSVICVGDLSLVKVHVHTNTPGEAITMALQLGEMINLKVDNMLEQNRELRAKMNVAEREMAIVTVAAGEGIINVFKDLGVDFVIKGGQTMNPSAEDIAEACRRVHAKNIFVFPNNKNIILAATHARALVDKNIVVIPTKSVNEGISACIAYNPEASVEENTESFLAAASVVKSGSVTYAVRTTKIDGLEIAQGDIIGLNDKSILTKAKTATDCVIKLVEKMYSDDISNITLFFGEDIREKDAFAVQDKLSAKYPNCEINTITGGQPVYYYLLSLE